jgi:hypothetical protein
MAMKADFSWGTVCSLLYIVDENKGNKSVTNDIENVLEVIRESFKNIARMKHFSLMKFTIIYRDTDGHWDGIKLANDKFLCFYPLRTDSFKYAASMALGQLDNAEQETIMQYLINWDKV